MSKAAGYGYALYELAAEEGLEKEIAEEFAEIAMIFECNLDFVKLLSSPRIPVPERIGALDHVFKKKIQPYLLFLLKILIEKGDISLTSLCFKEYQDQYYKDKNIVLVTAVSAVALNDNQRQRIIGKLEALMNQTIMLENKIDKTCIGGIRLEYRGNMIDASIKNRFKNLQNDLKNADYSRVEV